MTTDQDPYRYFRVEAREILDNLGQGLLALEKGAPEKDLVLRLLRLAHTLKGASRVVRQASIADMARAIEDALAPHREEKAPIPREAINGALELLDRMAKEVDRLDGDCNSEGNGIGDGSSPDPKAASARTPMERSASARVDIGELDGLVESVAEVGSRLNALRRRVREADRAGRTVSSLIERLDRRAGGAALPGELRSILKEVQGDVERLRGGLSVDVDGLDRESGLLRDAAGRLRLVPASDLFSPLERVARDAGQALEKKVEFVGMGGDHRVDAYILVPIRDALLHVVRNAVAHGVERESERLAAGKPAAGRVEVSIERKGRRLSFTCTDDGRGIDVEAVRKVAIGRGLIQADSAQPFSLDDAVLLLLRGGVTTQHVMNDLSGRAIGLDVVREIATRLKGRVAIRSVPGRGTTVEIDVPVTISASSVLLFGAAGMAAAVPREAVRWVLSVGAEDVYRNGDVNAIRFDGAAIPFVTLGSLVGARTPADRLGRPRPAVVLRSGSGVAALAVDRVDGIASLVVRSLPSAVASDPLALGTVLDGEGNVRVVLRADALVASAMGATVPAALEPSAERALPLLVIDDSLTTRMLEQSILESAGFDVDLATSAEEGLEKARRRRYGVFIVDVEMPGMNGFQFVSETRSDPALSGVPAIMVTSVDTPEARRSAETAGASAYIVKSEFDQDHLLRLIGSLSK